MTTSARYVDFGGLAEMGIPHSDRQLGRIEAIGDFPRRVKLSERKTVWVRDEVEAWLRSKEEARAMSCWVCGSPATRVMAGKQCCSRHTNYSRHPDDPPPAPCVVAGCGSPSHRREYGLPFCPAHNSYDLPPPRAA